MQLRKRAVIVASFVNDRGANVAIVRIQFNQEKDAQGRTLAQGTKVFVDGKPIQGVIGVALFAKPAMPWRAVIECDVQIDGELEAELENKTGG